MKIRYGFVSNSSSSSFLVVFPSIPSSVEETKTLLFGDNDLYPNPYPWNDVPNSWPAKNVAEIVFYDIQTQLDQHGPLSDEEAMDTGTSGRLDAKYPEYPQPTSYAENDWEMYDEYYKKCNDVNREVVREFLDSNIKHSPVLKFEYSDNDGVLSAAMEHGDLF